MWKDTDPQEEKDCCILVDAESIEDTKERQGLAIYGVGKMRCSDKDCTEELYEVAIEQGFMEMLYRVKRDYESNGGKQ